jgi:ligand-binding sensor domain-containing protein
LAHLFKNAAIMRKYVLLIIIFFFWAIVFAQKEPYSFSRIDIYNGLSHNQVNAVLKGKDGFMWFGTMSGLNRYNGYSMKVFRNNSQDTTSLIDNYISGLFELPDRKMWVVTRTGPCV